MQPLAATNLGGGLTVALDELERVRDLEQPAAITVVSTLIKAALGTAALLLGWVLGNLFEKYLFIAYGTGGPKAEENLYTEPMLREAFAG